MTEYKSDASSAALPKSGHVNEVCKEWLVREDGALAYKLQSQEITDFYKGNKYRNAVVRHDFPTALEEQIKEKETADKQTEDYRRYLTEQEEHDKQMAKEIADKLEQDLQEQRIRELEDSEQIAKELQEIYVNLPPPQRRPAPQPPRPDKASISTELRSQSQTHSTHKEPMHKESRSLSQHHHNNNYNAHTNNRLNTDQILSTENGNFHSFSAAPKTNPHESSSGRYMSNHNSYGDVADSIRQYDLQLDDQLPQSSPQPAPPISPSSSLSHSSKNNFNKPPPGSENNFRADYKFQKLSPEKFDYLMGNGVAALNIRPDPRDVNAMDLDLGADEIVNLEEFGLPLDEIKEMSLKIAQEKKDEALARQLQEMERKDGMTQEQRDRLLAIEAQDKELAKMLQEREKAKAKRAKEKARLKKTQQQQQQVQQNVSQVQSQPPPTEEEAYPPREIDPIDLEPYSNPFDLLQQTRPHERGSKDNPLLLPPDMEYTKEDDIYTLPVDSCRNSNRPNSLNITPEPLHHSMTRSENFAHDNHHDSIGSDLSPRMAFSKSSSFDQSSSPTPPYMPIQGTRRSNSSDERKKKSKDKCTHQ